MDTITKVQAYKVSCCGKLFKTERGAKIHMKLCCSNPSNKACKTCKKFIFDKDDNSKCNYLNVNENEYMEGLRIHCEDWEKI